MVVSLEIYTQALYKKKDSWDTEKKVDSNTTTDIDGIKQAPVWSKWFWIILWPAYNRLELDSIRKIINFPLPIDAICELW